MPLPLVSCVMPTANRRRFVPQAIRLFARQDYPNRELLIVDDGTEPVADLVPRDPSIRYIRLDGPRTLGAKRNACVSLSRGPLITHWDDDDWMAPHRISYQVSNLLAAEAEVCGLSSMLFYELCTGRLYQYRYPPIQRRWLAGCSLLYTRQFWQRAPFPDLQVGSDTQFIWQQPLDRALALPDYRFYVGLIHANNTSPKERLGPCWSPWQGRLDQLMGADGEFYAALRQSFAGEGAEPAP